MKVVEKKIGRGTQLGRITKSTMSVVRNWLPSNVVSSSVIIISAALLLCASCKKEEEENPITVESVEVSPSTLTLAVGETKTLTATVDPKEATTKVEWSVTSSTPEGVVTVNQKTGEVTAVKAGTATVTATAGDETAKCKVTVYDPEPDDPSTVDQGVEINGVIWATRNIAAPGHFADKDNDAGMFYQWNRNIGWSTTDPLVNSNGGTTWDTTIPTGTVWEAANDPSPEGWRVPTVDELVTLLETSKVTKYFTANHGVNGFLFTDIATGNELFLPTAGYRAGAAGTLYYPDFRGSYWSSTASDLVGRETYAHKIVLYGDGSASHVIDQFEYGFSVRSVKK
jgi:uncharacterized protein (TIGR02145 family)